MGHLREPSKSVEFALTDSNNERSSLRSSDDARSTGSPGAFDESGLLASSSPSQQIDERGRLARKVDKIREKIMRNTIVHQDGIENYLRITGNETRVQENAQHMRIKQHFEKKNKRYAQEMEALQRKLEEAEQRLEEFDKGVPISNPTTERHRMLQNVGHGIKWTGANLKEMTETVMSAPRDIAQKVKRNVFGSSENLPLAANLSNVSGGSVGEPSSSRHRPAHSTGSENIGHSKFYTPSPALIGQERLSGETDASDQIHPSPVKSDTAAAAVLRRHSRGAGIRPISQSVSYEHVTAVLTEEVELLKKKCTGYEERAREMNAEIGVLRSEVSASRFHSQKLEETLNEMMELHQNETRQLKNDIGLITTRFEYNYNTRCKQIEELIESCSNRVYKVETSVAESAQRSTDPTQTVLRSVLLSGANIIVETLKIVLCAFAVVNQFLKPVAASRKTTVFFFVALGALFVASFWSGITELVCKPGGILPCGLASAAGTSAAPGEQVEGSGGSTT